MLFTFSNFKGTFRFVDGQILTEVLGHMSKYFFLLILNSVDIIIISSINILYEEHFEQLQMVGISTPQG